MERGITLVAERPEGDWRSALRNWRDNPLYLRLSLARRRGTGARFIAKYAALIIALLPAGLTAGAVLLDRPFMANLDFELAAKSASIAYIVTACVVWFAQGFHQFVLDCMLLLNRSQRKQLSITVDDLSAVSGMSSHEIAVGALASILPSLWLRIFVTVAGGMVVFLALSTNFMEDVTNETVVAITFALPVVAAISLGGILATIALGLYLITMSENYSFSLASATAVLYSLGALFWMLFSTVLTLFTMQFTVLGFFSRHIEREVWMLSHVLAPLVFIMLVAAALLLVRNLPWLRPVYALGSPWLNPVLLVVGSMVLLAFSGNFTMIDDESFAIAMLALLYQLGSFAPLSLTHLPTLAMLGYDMEFDGIMLHFGAYVIHVVLQLTMIYLCGRYAIMAINNRRQSPLS